MEQDASSPSSRRRCSLESRTTVLCHGHDYLVLEKNDKAQIGRECLAS